MRVKVNKGNYGMKVDELLQYPKENGERLRQSILEGTYKTNTFRLVEILKQDDKKLPLKILMEVDQVIQQAIPQVLNPIFKEKFSNNSYGFR